MSEEKQSKKGWGCVQIAVALIVAALLFSWAIPGGSRLGARAYQGASAGNCRQIIAALWLYAGDHDGKYPDQASSEPKTSNQAFRILIKEGILDDERVFGSHQSPFKPDEVIGSSPEYSQALERGENHWAMTKGVTVKGPPLIPLVFENAVSNSWPPKWNADAAGKLERGRAWKDGKIIVGFNDSSVRPIKLESKKGTSVGPEKEVDGKDVFTRAAESMQILDIER